jgi:hypothetical protein
VCHLLEHAHAAAFIYSFQPNNMEQEHALVTHWCAMHHFLVHADSIPFLPTKQ